MVPNNVYSTDEVDTKLADLDDRLTAVEQGEPLPVPPDPPNPSLPNLTVTAIELEPPAPTAGQATNARLTAHNGGAQIAAGVIIGANVSVDDTEVSWASDDGVGGGLGSGLSVTITTAGHGGPFTMTEGDHDITVVVDDIDRVHEGSESDNRLTIPVTVAKAPPTPAGSVLFEATSLWNTDKAQAPPFHAPADGLIRGAQYGLNNSNYGHPCYVATQADPALTLHLPDSWNWPAQTIVTTCPAGALPASGTDGSMAIVMPNGWVVDMWQVKPDGGGTFRCSAYGLCKWRADAADLYWPHSGVAIGASGWGKYENGAVVGAGINAAACSGAGGLITKADVKAGTVAHALTMAWDYANLGGAGGPGPQVMPAVHNDCGGGPGPIPEGGLLQATGAVPSGLSPFGVALFNAAKLKGVYVVDKLDGQPMISGDGSSEVGAAVHANELTTIMRTCRLVKTW